MQHYHYPCQAKVTNYMYQFNYLRFEFFNKFRSPEELIPYQMVDSGLIFFDHITLSTT